MLELDKLVERMAQRNVQRVDIVGDQKMQLVSNGQNAFSTVIPTQELQQTISSIVPPNQMTQWEMQGRCQISYSSAYGVYQIIPERNNGTLKLSIVAPIVSQRMQAVVPSSLGINTDPAPASPNQLPPAPRKTKKNIPVNLKFAGVGAILLLLIVGVPLISMRQRAENEKVAQQAMIQDKNKRYKEYSAAIKNLSNIGLVTKTFPGDRGGEDYVIVLEDNLAFNTAVSDLESKIKSDPSLPGSETAGDKGKFLEFLKSEAIRNSPYERAIVFNKKAGRLVYENIGVYGKDALDFPGVVSVIMTFKGMQELSQMKIMARRDVSELVSYADKYYENAPLSKAIS